MTTHTIAEQEEQEQNTLLHEDETFSLGFTQVPNKVLYARNLSPQAKTLYAILLSYSWKEDRCFPGYARLCEHMGIRSRRIVRKYMQELEDVHLLKQKRRGLGKTNIYTLLSLKNATLNLAFEDDGHTGDHQKEDRGDHQDETTGDQKEYEVEEDEFQKDEDSSKNALKAEVVSAYSHREQGTIRKIVEEETKEQQHPTSTEDIAPPSSLTPPNRAGESKNENPRFGEIGRRPLQSYKKTHETRPPAYVGKPLTQDEIDARKREGKNASGLTPLPGLIPPEHWRELETTSGKSSHRNGHNTHYNNSTQNSPVFIDAIIEQFSTLLGDEPENIPININRAAKLYRETGMEEEAFHNILHQALEQAKRYLVHSHQR